MKLTLDVINHWNEKKMKNYLKFSKLMETNTRSFKRVFLEIQATLTSQIGEFIIIKNSKNKIVGYCLLYHGQITSKYKRIAYFAVPVHYRNKGFGVLGMKMILKELIDLDEGCTLACEANLNSFYKQTGLIFIKLDDENKTEHIMGFECNKNKVDLNMHPTINKNLIENTYDKFDKHYKLSKL